MDLSWRARLQYIDRGWLDMAFTVPLLDCSRARRELRLDSEMDLDGCLGRSPGRRRAPAPHQQPTFAATLDARSSATRCDRGVDLIASATLNAPAALSRPAGLIEPTARKKKDGRIRGRSWTSGRGANPRSVVALWWL